ncbi:quinolinate synthase NadA, partial [candidate division NPL-UPA2 bacterium]|nr:quinolinate synthase NadA [candidate division NPL-UPA2 bacterium]
CPNMKYTTLEKIAQALKTMTPQITVPERIREKAAVALERMLKVRG